MQRKDLQNIYREFKANQQIFRVLESSKSLTDGIFDQLPVCLVLLDQEQKVLKFNKTASETFHKSEQELLGTTLNNFFDDEIRDQIDHYFKNGDEKPKISFEQQLKCEDGKDVFLYWQLCEVFNSNQQEAVHALLGNDITEARNALESLVELKSDLELASTVQNTLLPEQSTLDTSYCSLAGYYQPATQVGGDLWLCREYEEGTLAILIDVMGHGAGSAMVTALVSGAMEALLPDVKILDQNSVTGFLKKLDRIVTESCRNQYMVCTNISVIPKNENKIIVYANGIPSPAILNSERPRSIHAPGAPLGLADVPFTTGIREQEFKPGERFVMFTDGCYEILTPEGMMGRPKFVKMMKGFADENPTSALNSAVKKIKDLMGSEYASDDITMIIIDRK